MLYVYIDDSGTSPSQKIAVASAVIIPATRIGSFDVAWQEFNRNYGFDGDFHSSVCAARNKGSAFADWSDRKTGNAFRRLRRIMKAHAECGFSLASHKDEFRRIVPASWFEIGGNSIFTWSLRTLLSVLRTWSDRQPKKAPFEYIVDWMEPHEQHEVNMLMAQFEAAYPGEYDGHFSFRKRRDVPGLQPCDHVAWSSFAAARLYYEGTPLNPFALAALAGMRSGEWLNLLVSDEDSLRDTVKMDSQDTEGEAIRRNWYEQYIAKKPRKRRKK